MFDCTNGLSRLRQRGKPIDAMKENEQYIGLTRMAELATDAWYHGVGTGHYLCDNADNAITAMDAGYGAISTYGPSPYNPGPWSVVSQGAPGFGFYP